MTMAQVVLRPTPEILKVRELINQSAKIFALSALAGTGSLIAIISLSLYLPAPGRFKAFEPGIVKISRDNKEIYSFRNGNIYDLLECASRGVANLIYGSARIMG
jgi:hypothetical protein